MRKTRSTLLEAVHETARDLHSAGVMAQVTLREFDRICLPPVPPLAPRWHHTGAACSSATTTERATNWKLPGAARYFTTPDFAAANLS